MKLTLNITLGRLEIFLISFIGQSKAKVVKTFKLSVFEFYSSDFTSKTYFLLIFVIF